MRGSSADASVNEGATPRPILAAMDQAGVDELAVTSHVGVFTGMVERRAVERCLYDREDKDATAAALAEQPVARVSPDDAVEDAVDAMLASNLEVMPVVSRGGQLEGVLVLDDLRRVPNFVESIAESRRQRAMAADGGAEKVVMGCSLASIGLGLLLFALWILGPAYGLPRWVSWLDGIAAALAFIGALTAFSREMLAIPVWAITGVGLCFAASIAHASNRGAWSTWVQLAFAVAFLAMAALIGMRWPRRRHRALREA